MQDIVLTIFTPTYNRAYILPILFDSLRRQTNKSFEWLIIDDGSTDGTGAIVEAFIKEADFTVKCFHKENGGKHTAINMMLDIIDTEMVLIVDSDDYLSADAVETIIMDYSKIKNKERVASIEYLRMFHDGRIIGDKFKRDAYIGNVIKDAINKGIKGDKCDVFLTHAIINFRFPVFEGENFMGETVLWIPLFREYDSLFRNKAIYYCEYYDDGLTRAGRGMRIRNPMGGIENSVVHFNSDIKWSLRVKSIILYIAYNKFAKKAGREVVRDVKQVQEKCKYVFLYPIAHMLYLYWGRKHCK